MAKFPNVSPEVFTEINRNPRVIELVSKMIEATHDYVTEWDGELSDLHEAAGENPIEALVALANSVQEVADTLVRFRGEGIEIQSENLAEFMQQSEDAFQEMQKNAEGTGPAK